MVLLAAVAVRSYEPALVKSAVSEALAITEKLITKARAEKSGKK